MHCAQQCLRLRQRVKVLTLLSAFAWQSIQAISCFAQVPPDPAAIFQTELEARVARSPNNATSWRLLGKWRLPEEYAHALAAGVLAPAYTFLSRLDIRRVARPYMQKLAIQPGVTVSLATRHFGSRRRPDGLTPANSFAPGVAFRGADPVPPGNPPGLPDRHTRPGSCAAGAERDKGAAGLRCRGCRAPDVEGTGHGSAERHVS